MKLAACCEANCQKWARVGGLYTDRQAGEAGWVFILPAAPFRASSRRVRVPVGLGSPPPLKAAGFFTGLAQRVAIYEELVDQASVDVGSIGFGLLNMIISQLCQLFVRDLGSHFVVVRGDVP